MSGSIIIINTIIVSKYRTQINKLINNAYQSIITILILLFIYLLWIINIYNIKMAYKSIIIIIYFVITLITIIIIATKFYDNVRYVIIITNK